MSEMSENTLHISINENAEGEVWLFVNGTRYRTTPPIADLLKLKEWRLKTALAEPLGWDSWAQHE